MFTEDDILYQDQDSFVAEEKDLGKRLDVLVSERFSLSRSASARLIEDGLVTVCGSVASKKQKISVGDEVVATFPQPQASEAQAEDIPLDVVYEDDDIIVVCKPQGMVVHPAAGNTTGTLVNALLYHCKGSLSGIGGVVRPGIVHRIDKDTGGLLVVAKNDDAHVKLSEQIKRHDVSRIYTAIVIGNIKEDTGTINAPIGRHPVDRKKMAIIRSADRRSREAVTHWQVIERFGAFTLVRCVLETGRTHQIRVHMASIGHPLLGDTVYGGDGTAFESKNKKYIFGQCLFAAELRLTHPRTNKLMTFKADLPQNFITIIDKLRSTYFS